MFILGFDFGLKYIGVALGQSITKTSSPLDTIIVKNEKYKWKIINNIILNWRPLAIIIGKPSITDHNNFKFVLEIDKFSRRLECKFNIPIYFVDETLSTWEAKSCFISKKNKNYFKKINAISAAIIVEQWFFEDNVI